MKIKTTTLTLEQFAEHVKQRILWENIDCYQLARIFNSYFKSDWSKDEMRYIGDSLFEWKHYVVEEN